MSLPSDRCYARKQGQFILPLALHVPVGASIRRVVNVQIATGIVNDRRIENKGLKPLLASLENNIRGIHVIAGQSFIESKPMPIVHHNHDLVDRSDRLNAWQRLVLAISARTPGLSGKSAISTYAPNSKDAPGLRIPFNFDNCITKAIDPTRRQVNVLMHQCDNLGIGLSQSSVICRSGTSVTALGDHAGCPAADVWRG